MRLFVGIRLADAVVRELAALVARLRSGASEERPVASHLRWTGPESWHITLQFLGNATQEQFECLSAQLGELRAVPVAVRMGELGCFDRAGVLFAGVVVTPDLAALQQAVVKATGRCGFIAETRPFHPHITLARKTGNKGPRDRGSKKSTVWKELMAREGNTSTFSGFTAQEFVLYESHLGREGAHFEVRRRFALARP